MSMGSYLHNLTRRSECLNYGSSNPIAMYLSVATDVAAFILTFITNHETGVVKVLPYKIHLAVDFMVGVVFALAPFVLGFKGLDMAYYLVLGLTVLAVVGFHKPSAAAMPAAA